MGRNSPAPLEGIAKVFGDTSYFYAVLDVTDQFHQRAALLSQQLTDYSIRVATTWEIVVECATLLRYRAGFAASEIFLSTVVPEIEVIHPADIERSVGVQIFLQRSRERKLSLWDAISYAIVSTRLNWIPCLSFDEDFGGQELHAALTTVVH